MRSVHNIFRAIGAENVEIKEATRLGRIIHDRSRLLRVKCCDVVSQMEILKRSRSLKNIDGYKNIFINKDLTVDEQRRQKLLRVELARRRSEGEEVIIRNGRVVQLDVKQPPIRRDNFR